MATTSLGPCTDESASAVFEANQFLDRSTRVTAKNGRMEVQIFLQHEILRQRVEATTHAATASPSDSFPEKAACSLPLSCRKEALTGHDGELDFKRSLNRPGLQCTSGLTQTRSHRNKSAVAFGCY
jgi:hypothetical protein